MGVLVVEDAEGAHPGLLTPDEGRIPERHPVGGLQPHVTAAEGDREDRTGGGRPRVGGGDDVDDVVVAEVDERVDGAYDLPGEGVIAAVRGWVETGAALDAVRRERP